MTIFFRAAKCKIVRWENRKMGKSDGGEESRKSVRLMLNTE